jgi:hypothetical protein
MPDGNDAEQARAEELTARAFVSEERVQRILTLLSTQAGRIKLRRLLAHCDCLDDRYVVPIPADRQDAGSIGALLRSLGAGESCHLLAEAAAMDGRTMPLDDALQTLVGRGAAAVVICIPGRLAYFEGEEPGDRYVLERK